MNGTRRKNNTKVGKLEARIRTAIWDTGHGDKQQMGRMDIFGSRIGMAKTKYFIVCDRH
jgi:hypothetical protein